MSYAKRTDSTHTAIRSALRRALGARNVLDTHNLPGFVDLVALRAGRVYLLDAKSATGKPTPSQQALVDAGWPIAFPETPQEALAAVGLCAAPEPRPSPAKRARGQATRTAGHPGGKGPCSA